MAIPLYLLALGAVVIGIVMGPTHIYAHYLHHTPNLPEPSGEAMGINVTMMLVSSVIGIVGILWAYLAYGKHPGAAGVREDANPLVKLSLNGLYLDRLYLEFIVKPLRGVAEASELFDKYVIDKLVDIVGMIPRVIGAIGRPVQNGLIQNYAFVMLLGLAAGLWWVLQALAG
jgi:NADH-quinone oxidoreductase subunit L